MRRFHQRSIPVALYPESARQLAAAWPRLEDLAIRAHSVEHRLYRELRRDDLLALARSFPSAEALAAPVHPVRDDQAYNPSAIDPPPSASNSFGLGESANLARAVDGMAACLAKMFAPARLEDDWVEVERSGAE
ncbi:hypothetical protein PsYK624_140950 [Phanerochaete sordida]|uniref:Uncharacterized protein n=1 Tax=Phanerochaete sordida TaxID=48140 RepID=A0A9P3LJX4_9APHY|nr:hypothetical protein PsYK624_140950 [Phanerochaete sordida]